jgi:hypothetical protein
LIEAPFFCFIEMTTPAGELVFARYITWRGPERAAADEALELFANADKVGYRLRGVSVFNAEPATFFAKPHSRYVAADQP